METSKFCLIVHCTHAFQRLAKTASPDYEPLYGRTIPISLTGTSTLGTSWLLEAAVDDFLLLRCRGEGAM